MTLVTNEPKVISPKKKGICTFSYRRVDRARRLSKAGRRLQYCEVEPKSKFKHSLFCSSSIKLRCMQSAYSCSGADLLGFRVLSLVKV